MNKIYPIEATNTVTQPPMAKDASLLDSVPNSTKQKYRSVSPMNDNIMIPNSTTKKGPLGPNPNLNPENNPEIARKHQNHHERARLRMLQAQQIKLEKLVEDEWKAGWYKRDKEEIRGEILNS